MNKILKEITIDMYNSDLDYIFIKRGNYSVKRTSTNIYHYYFGNCICLVNLMTKQFNLYDCGYTKFRLTTAQLNFLEQFYKNKGYILNYKE